MTSDLQGACVSQQRPVGGWYIPDCCLAGTAAGAEVGGRNWRRLEWVLGCGRGWECWWTGEGQGIRWGRGRGGGGGLGFGDGAAAEGGLTLKQG